jgi:hypothetical protein
MAALGHAPALGGLRDALAEARASGLPFDDVWPALAREFLDPDVREETRPAWERAYERMPPTEGDRAAARLAALVDGVEVAPATPQTSGAW